MGVPARILALLAVWAIAPTPALACSCGGGPTVWPSGVADVPRTSHVLLYRVAPTARFALLDLGSVPVQPTLDAVLRYPQDVPEGLTVQATERVLRDVPLLVRELVPAAPLPPKHRFVVVETESWGRAVVGGFETGDGTTLARAGAPDWILDRLVAPNLDAEGAACESGSGNAVYRERDGQNGPKLYGLRKPETRSAGPEYLVLLDRGQVSLGRLGACSSFGVGLGSGRHEFEIREWQGDGFGPASRIAFEIPPEEHRGPIFRKMSSDRRKL